MVNGLVCKLECETCSEIDICVTTHNLMKKYNLFYPLIILFFSCGEHNNELCIQSIEIIGNGLRINIDSAKEKEVFENALEEAHEHHYFSTKYFSIIEIDTATLKVVSNAYSMFRREVQERHYNESQLTISDSFLNGLNTFSSSPLEISMVFKESTKLPNSSFPNYYADEDKKLSTLLLGQKVIESIY
ncbi:MAG: hypothetical protein ACI85I_001766 [Arenicella sp.]|jgi:hypothetical protein